MLKQSVTPQDVCDLLNWMLSVDPACIEALVSTRVPCNEIIAEHASIQVQAGILKIGDVDMRQCEVGLLGVLNGLFGRHEMDLLEPHVDGVPDKIQYFHGWGSIVMRSDPLAQPKIAEFVTLEEYMADAAISINETNDDRVLTRGADGILRDENGFPEEELPAANLHEGGAD